MEFQRFHQSIKILHLLFLKGLGREVFEKKEVQSSKLHMLRVMPDKKLKLPGGIMADLTLMRYPGYENLPSKKKT